MNKRTRVRKTSHCGTKIRHPSRREAIFALAATRRQGQEAMHPYPCKFCAGWHNGHRQVQPLMSFEPKCNCGHNASHHDHLGGYGCYECECLESLEFVYRFACRRLSRDRDYHIERVRRTHRMFGEVMRRLPCILREAIATALRERSRGRS